MSTAPAAAPVATPAMVPFACCLSGVMVGRELSEAVVELGLGLGLELELELRVEDVDDVL